MTFAYLKKLFVIRILPNTNSFFYKISYFRMMREFPEYSIILKIILILIFVFYKLIYEFKQVLVLNKLYLYKERMGLKMLSSVCSMN